MVMADGMNEHGGRSANPPSASFYGERNMIATRYVLISPKRPFLMGRFWRKANIGETLILTKVSPLFSANRASSKTISTLGEGEAG